MAPEKNEGLEHQDQSIKARKFQLFDEGKPEEGGPLRPFAEYVRQTPAASLSPVVKASLWATGVLAILLFIAAMLGWGTKTRRRQAEVAPSRPAVVAWPMGQAPSSGNVTTSSCSRV
jgi:hypothetical protein